MIVKESVLPLAQSERLSSVHVCSVHRAPAAKVCAKPCYSIPVENAAVGGHSWVQALCMRLFALYLHKLRVSGVLISNLESSGQ